MYYKLIRNTPEGKAVHGKLYRVSHYYNKRTGLMVERLHPICDTLENADYLVPALIYKVQVTQSPCCPSSSKSPDVPEYDSTAALYLSTVKAVSLSPPPWSNPSPLAGFPSNPPQTRPVWRSVTTLTITAMKQESEEQSWTKVLLEIIIKILTLGFYHIEKHRKN